MGDALPVASAVLGPTQHESGISLPAMRCVTGGDINPDCPRALWRTWLVSGGHVAGRRLLPCPRFIRSHGHGHPFGHPSRSRAPYTKPFPISSISFLPDDEGKYTSLF